LAIFVAFLAWVVATRPGTSTGLIFALAVVLLIGAALLMPSAVHEGYGRWQLRPVCWEEGGMHWVEIRPRWSERFSCRCVVTDERDQEAFTEFSEPLSGRAPLRFPEHFRLVAGMKAGTAQPQGSYTVRWEVKQAGQTFHASTRFGWR